RPWGFWATLAWAVVAFGLGALVIFGIAWVTSRDSENPDLIADPWFPLMLIGVNAVQVAGLAIAARAAGWPIARYLALVPPTRRDFLMGFFALIILIAALELVTRFLGRDTVEPFQADAYRAARNAGMVPLLWIAFVIAAPAGEEILFRGFVFRGWAASPLGPVWTIVLTSAIFSAMHTQYDWFGILQTGLIALVFGWLRWRGGSTLLSILLHTL